MPRAAHNGTIRIITATGTELKGFFPYVYTDVVFTCLGSDPVVTGWRGNKYDKAFVTVVFALVIFEELIRKHVM